MAHEEMLFDVLFAQTRDSIIAEREVSAATLLDTENTSKRADEASLMWSNTPLL